LGRIIQIFTHSRINHAGLVIRFDQYQGQQGHVWTLEALAGGISLGLLSKVLGTYSGYCWLYPLKDQYDPLRNRLGEWALEQVGTPYDYYSLIMNAFGHVKTSVESLFCSEFNFLDWEKAGIVTGNIAPTPADIPKLGIFKAPIQIL
jgi:hypothetical protein